MTSRLFTPVWYFDAVVLTLAHVIPNNAARRLLFVTKVVLAGGNPLRYVDHLVTVLEEFRSQYGAPFFGLRRKRRKHVARVQLERR